MGEEEEKREYNLLMLILLIILCWPAAIAYYLTRPKAKPKPLRMCTGCGREVSFEYNICPFCGKSLAVVAPPPATVTPTPPSPPPTGVKFCSSCGARIDPAAKFCPSCGKAIS